MNYEQKVFHKKVLPTKIYSRNGQLTPYNSAFRNLLRRSSTETRIITLQVSFDEVQDFLEKLARSRKNVEQKSFELWKKLRNIQYRLDEENRRKIIFPKSARDLLDFFNLPLSQQKEEMEKLFLPLQLEKNTF